MGEGGLASCVLIHWPKNVMVQNLFLKKNVAVDYLYYTLEAKKHNQRGSFKDVRSFVSSFFVSEFLIRKAKNHDRKKGY